jgi:uncharacterized protein (TIGR02172 family)
MDSPETKHPGPKLADGRTAEIFAWGEDRILKLYRPGWTRRTAEFEFAQALASQQTGYRVPRVDEIVEIGERIGLVYQRVDGVSMLQAIQRNPLRLPAFSRQLADLHLDMHRRNAAGLEPVQERLAGKIQAVDALTADEKRIIHEKLFRLPAENKLLHGDFHPDNILLTADGPVIIDWIDATLGHPLADVARTWVIGNFGIPPEEKFGVVAFRWMVDRYLARYLRRSPYERKQLQAWILPVAAGRLSESIPHETVPLRAYVRQLLQGLA